MREHFVVFVCTLAVIFWSESLGHVRAGVNTLRCSYAARVRLHPPSRLWKSLRGQDLVGASSSTLITARVSCYTCAISKGFRNAQILVGLMGSAQHESGWSDATIRVEDDVKMLLSLWWNLLGESAHAPRTTHDNHEDRDVNCALTPCRRRRGEPAAMPY